MFQESAVAATFNAFAVYEVIGLKVRMIVVDAVNPTDPAWNPPLCLRLPIPVDTYNSFGSPDSLLSWITSQLLGL